MTMSTRRQSRVSDRIQEELGDLLEKKVGDPRLDGVTITKVESSADLEHAAVYFSLLGDAERRKEALAGFKAASGFLRHELASRLGLRHVPQLSFQFDPSLEEGDRLIQLFEEIEREAEHGSG
jgi:ribosome-binding factor A